MRTYKFTQRNGERKLYALDYSEWLNAGETINSTSFSISPATTTSFAITNTQYLNGNTGVAFFATGGDVGTRYEVSVLTTTSSAQLKEDKIYFTVIE